MVVSDINGAALEEVEATLRKAGIDAAAAVVDLDRDDAPDLLIDAAVTTATGK